MVYESEVAKLRRRIPDPEGSDALFTDNELTEYVEDQDGNWKLALADIWDSIAGNHLLLFKVNVRSDDATVTASATAALYLRRAAELRSQVESEMNVFMIAGGETEWA